ncbi:MAG: erythromycin esterase family protein [Bacteroidetes bacterium]|nr:erythromycin esterase family protein [Bacteroidota bacterium]
MKGLFLTVFSLWLGFSGIAQTLSSPSINYDFDFLRLERGASSWKLNGRNYTFSIDQAEKQKGVRALKISGYVSGLLNSDVISFDCKISQLIPLPKTALKGVFTIDTKMQNVDLSWIKIYGLDYNEQVIRKDSINLIYSEIWKNHRAIFNLKGIHSIYIEVGVSSSIAHFKEHRENTDFSLSRLSLIIDGKDIYSLATPVKSVSDQQLVDIKQNTQLDNHDAQSYAAINDLKTHRFVALGETVPGSVSSQESAYNLMKEMIQHQNCRLVLLDYPLSSTLQWNQYVHGDLKTKYQEFLSPLVYGSKSPTLFESFLEWVKQYNQLSDQKVTIAGFDTQGVIYYNYLADYLISLNKSSLFFDSLLLKVCKQQFKEAFRFASNHDSLNNYLKPAEANLFLSALKNLTRAYLNEGKPEIDKSFLRFNNIKEIITSQLKKDEKAVIFADFSSVNKLNVNPSAIFSHSIGYWLNREYGNEFYSIAILLGNGLYTYANTVEITAINELDQPLSGSLEDLCMKSNQSVFYKSLSSDLYNRIGYMYWVDRSMTMSQFERCNYKKRMDAIIFIRNSKGFDIPQDWPKNDKGFYDFNAALMQKDFERHYNKKFYHPTRRYRVYFK